jgi:hypothetical protein
MLSGEQSNDGERGDGVFNDAAVDQGLPKRAWDGGASIVVRCGMVQLLLTHSDAFEKDSTADFFKSLRGNGIE